MATQPTSGASMPDARWIPFDQIEVDPENLAGRPPDREHIETLAGTVDQWILDDPSKIYQTGGGRYRLLLGEHRYHAARLAGKEALYCHVMDHQPTRAEKLEAQLRENHNRRTESPVLVARKLKGLIDEGWSHARCAQLFGSQRTEAWVRQMLAINDMPRPVLDLIDSSQLPVTAPRWLSPLLPWPDRLTAVARQATKENWTRDQLLAGVKQAMTQARQDSPVRGSSSQTPPASVPGSEAGGVCPTTSHAAIAPPRGHSAAPPSSTTADGGHLPPTSAGTVSVGEKPPSAASPAVAGSGSSPSSTTRPVPHVGTPPASDPGTEAGGGVEPQGAPPQHPFYAWCHEQADPIIRGGRVPAAVIAPTALDLIAEAFTTFPDETAARLTALFAGQSPQSETPARVRQVIESHAMPAELARSWAAADPDTQSGTGTLLAHPAGRLLLRHAAIFLANARSTGADAALVDSEALMINAFALLASSIPAGRTSDDSSAGHDAAGPTGAASSPAGDTSDTPPVATAAEPDVAAAPARQIPAHMPLFLDHVPLARDPDLAAGMLVHYRPENAPLSTRGDHVRLAPWHLDARRWRVALIQATTGHEGPPDYLKVASWDDVEMTTLAKAWEDVNAKIRAAIRRDDLLRFADASVLYWLWLEMHGYPILEYDRLPGTAQPQIWEPTPEWAWVLLPEITKVQHVWIAEATEFLATVDACTSWAYASNRTLADIRERWPLAGGWTPRSAEYKNEEAAWGALAARATALTQAAQAEMLATLESVRPAPLPAARSGSPSASASPASAHSERSAAPTESAPEAPAEPPPAPSRSTRQAREDDVDDLWLPDDVAHLFLGAERVRLPLGRLPMAGGTPRVQDLIKQGDELGARARHSRKPAAVTPGIALCIPPDTPMRFLADETSDPRAAAADVALCDIFSKVIAPPPGGWPVLPATAEHLPDRIPLAGRPQPAAAAANGQADNADEGLLGRTRRMLSRTGR